MMKKVLGLLIMVLLVAACKKESTPKSSDGYFFDYKVSISNKIEEPTIINGYYGYVHEYKGNFMPNPEAAEPKKPKVVTNQILFFDAVWKEEIEKTAITKDGIKFYDLRKIKQENIQPKFFIYPNKQGFYQFDTNGRKYVGLIQVTKRLGYMNGGLKEFGGLNNQLINYEMRIDYDATF